MARLQLREWQSKAVEKSRGSCPGIFLEALGGRGKTICALSIAKDKGAKKILIVNNRLNILKGWIQTLPILEFDKDVEVTTITDKKLQNLISAGEMISCDVLILDEWQNISSESNYKAYKK